MKPIDEQKRKTQKPGELDLQKMMQESIEKANQLNTLEPKIRSTFFDPKLAAAYRGTHFHVYSCDPFVLEIDSYSEELLKLHDANGVDSSIFITAHNPFSEVCTDAQNVAAQSSLIEAVNQLGYIWIEGEGKDPDGEWPGETSILVLGCNRIQGEELGRRYKQNAIVWCSESAVPELVLL